MNILFLSDIHFGREWLVSGNFEHRDEIMDKVIETISALPDNIKPHYIVTTGDIAWSGSYGEYQKAYDWYSELLQVTGLTGKHLSFCAGNHDIDRKVAVEVSESEIITENGINLAKVDYLYNYNHTEEYEVQIREYNEFCHKLGVIPYEYPVDPSDANTIVCADKIRYSYTIGEKTIKFGKKGYKIVGFNTAMLSGYSNMDDDDMFIGLPQIEKLVEQGRLKQIDKSKVYTIALLHHAERFLNTNEMNSYGVRKATLPTLMKYANLILCGHTETCAVPTINMQEGGGRMINGGATYYSDDHRNSFSILHIDEADDSFDFCTYIWKNGEWVCDRDVTEIDWEIQSEEMRLPGFLTDSEDPWQIKIIAGGKEKSISVPFMDHGLYAVNNQMVINYNNYRDINRLLDIYATQERFIMGRAKPYKNSVQAMLEHAEFRDFILSATNNGELPYTVAIITPDGKVANVFHQSSQPLQVEENEREIIDVLKSLRKIEDYYGVRFSVSDDESILPPQRAVIIALESMIEEGGGALVQDPGAEYIYDCSSKSVFDRIICEKKYGGKRSICLSYNVPLVCNILEAAIDFGVCEVNICNLEPYDLNRIIKLRDNFMDGDRRRIAFSRMGQKTAIIIPKNCSEYDAVKDIQARINRDALRIRIQPQSLALGSSITPNKACAKKIGMNLESTLQVRW